jgi:hypothetical protein
MSLIRSDLRSVHHRSTNAKVGSAEGEAISILIACWCALPSRRVAGALDTHRAHLRRAPCPWPPHQLPPPSSSRSPLTRPRQPRRTCSPSTPAASRSPLTRPFWQSLSCFIASPLNAGVLLLTIIVHPCHDLANCSRINEPITEQEVRR